MQAPNFWRGPGPSVASLLLSPAAHIYGLLGRIRNNFSVPWRASVPVICIGNLVAGGAGKTPVVLKLIDMLKQRGIKPHALSRGYGGTLTGPMQVDPSRHNYRETGDEPLLLAKHAPTWIAKDRVLGAQAATEAATDAEAIIMDDGFQNPALAKDLSLVVVDGNYGFGNGHLIPAGPLRESIKDGLRRAHAVVLIGADSAGVEDSIRQHGRDDQRQSERAGQGGLGKPEIRFPGRQQRRKGIIVAGPDQGLGDGEGPDDPPERNPFGDDFGLRPRRHTGPIQFRLFVILSRRDTPYLLALVRIPETLV